MTDPRPATAAPVTAAPSAGPLPALYLGHGAPPLLDDPLWMGELSAWAARLPRPKAVLIVSAHWQTAPMALSATTPVPLVYDFYGFPQRFYDLEYRALRPETVPSGDGQRRVALGTRHFAARLTREIFPALAQAAFLVARLDDDSPDPIAAGPSELFVGEDPAGFARLPLVGPGERFTLPLGVDRAVQPVRRIDLVQGEAGFFSKDDVGSYKVTIELANPYPRPIDVRVIDQWPVSHDEHVQVTLDEVSPRAAQDSDKGELDWTLTLPAASKQILGFSFTVRCPRGWLLTQ